MMRAAYANLKLHSTPRLALVEHYTAPCPGFTDEGFRYFVPCQRTVEITVSAGVWTIPARCPNCDRIYTQYDLAVMREIAEPEPRGAA